MILKTLILILTAIPVLGIWALSSYILESDSNHTAFDVLILLWPLFFCVAIAGLIYIIKKPRLAIIPIGANLVAICFYLFVDHFNIMVQYDKWIWRSMPGPFEESRMKESDTHRGADNRLGEKMTALGNGEITEEEYALKSPCNAAVVIFAALCAGGYNRRDAPLCGLPNLQKRRLF
jgi:hypothetical protein